MPLSAYYHGHGSEVMSAMRKQYGDRAESIFYALANKRGEKPGGKSKRKKRRARKKRKS